jgi:hypothetical protein
MNTREYYELFRYLMGECCLAPESLLFVESVAGWCREHITSWTTRNHLNLFQTDKVFRMLIKGFLMKIQRRSMRSTEASWKMSR